MDANELLKWFSSLSALRSKSEVLRRGDLRAYKISDGVIRIERVLDGSTYIAFVNTGAPFRAKTEGRVLFLGNTDVLDGEAVIDTLGYILYEK